MKFIEENIAVSLQDRTETAEGPLRVEKGAKKRRFHSIYRRLRMLSIPLTILMSVLVALSVIRAARGMIFTAYKDSAEFGMKTLAEEIRLKGLDSKSVQACLEQARKRSSHQRNFMLIKGSRIEAYSGEFDSRQKTAARARRFLEGRECRIEISGIGPFIRLFGVLRMDGGYGLVMTEKADFITGSYLQSGAAIIGIILLCSTVITLLFSRRLFMPMMNRLERIRDALNRYGSGQLDVRLHVNPSDQDEFDLVCTEFNRMADTIEELNKKLVDRMESERRLLSTLAHDINTPVTVLRGHAENLVEHGTELREDQFMSIATGLLSQSIYIQTLVDDLLTMASSKVAKLELMPSLIELDPVLDSTVNVFEPLAGQLGMNIVADGQGLWIFADRVRLSQILNNLVMNGLRHAEGATLVELYAEKHGEGVLISVCDDGCGMDDKGMGKRRARDERGAKTGKSYGLGLTIVEMLAHMHGGWVRSKKNPHGRGTCFEVWFPDKKT